MQRRRSCQNSCSIHVYVVHKAVCTPVLIVNVQLSLLSDRLEHRIHPGDTTHTHRHHTHTTQSQMLSSGSPTKNLVVSPSWWGRVNGGTILSILQKPLEEGKIVASFLYSLSFFIRGRKRLNGGGGGGVDFQFWASPIAVGNNIDYISLMFCFFWYLNSHFLNMCVLVSLFEI